MTDRSDIHRSQTYQPAGSAQSISPLAPRDPSVQDYGPPSLAPTDPMIAQNPLAAPSALENTQHIHQHVPQQTYQPNYQGSSLAPQHGSQVTFEQHPPRDQQMQDFFRKVQQERNEQEQSLNYSIQEPRQQSPEQFVQEARAQFFGQQSQQRNTSSRAPTSHKFSSPSRTRPTKTYQRMNDKEKAEAYFELYDRNLDLRNSHNELEDRVKKLTSQLSRLQSDVKYERQLAESYTGADFKSSMIGGDHEKVIAENRRLRTELKELRSSFSQSRRGKGKGKVPTPTLRAFQYKPKVLSTATKSEELDLIEKLRVQLAQASEEIVRLQAELQHKGPDIGNEYKEKATQLATYQEKYYTLEESFKAQKLYLENTRKQLDEAVSDLRKERTKVAELEIKLRAAELHSTGSLDMARRIEELTIENRKLEAQIQELCRSPFIRDAGQRLVSGSRLTSVEQDLQKKASSLEEYKARILKLEAEIARLNHELSAKSKNNEDLKEENVKLKVLLEERNKRVDDFEAHLRALAGEGDVNAFMKALGIMKLRGDEPAWAQLDFLERHTVMPNDPDSLKREVERLKLEKGQLAAELEKAQSLLTLRNDMEKESRALHQSEMEQMKLKLQSAQRRVEELARVSDFRANRVVELEKNQRLNIYDEDNRIIATKKQFKLSALDGMAAEFLEDNTEVGTSENILDLWIGEAEFYSVALQNTLRETMSDFSNFVSFVAVDFYNHETQTTSPCEGFQPKYCIHISFKVNSDDFFINYLEKDHVYLQVHAAYGNTHISVASSKIPLTELLDRTSAIAQSTTSTSVIESNVSLVSDVDGRTAVGVLHYKLRMRYPISEALRWYREEQRVVHLTHPQVQAIDTVYTSKVPEGRKRQLSITVYKCQELVGRGYPGDLRPFVYYQFFTEADAMTKTGLGPDPIFDEIQTFTLVITPDLQRYLDRENLQVIVFDDSAPIKDNNQDVIGFAYIPLSPLVIDTAVEGIFELYNSSGNPTGSISLRISWRDSKVDAMGYGTPLTEVWEKDVYARIARSIKERGLGMNSAFNIFDQDQDGVISPQEFRTTILITLRLAVSEQEIQMLINACNLMDGGVTKTEFRQKFLGLLSDDMDDAASWEEAILNRIRARIQSRGLNLRQTFEAFDWNKDGNVDADEFRRTFQVMQLGLSEDEIEQLLHRFDPRNTGKISYLKFEEMLFKNAKTKEWEEQILRKVRERVDSRGLSIQQAFAAFDLDGNGTVTAREFKETFQIMQLGLTEEEIDRLLISFDPNRTGTIDFRTFCQKLEAIQTSGNWEESILNRMRQRIRENRLDLRKAFQAFDLNGDGRVDANEFRETMKIMQFDLSNQQIERLLAWFDPQRSGNLDYNRFLQLLEGGQPQYEAPSQNWADQIIERIRKRIVENQLNIGQAFQVIDRNRDKSLGLPEFRQAMHTMQFGLTEGEITRLFEYFDLNKNGEISYNEFYSRLRLPPERTGSYQQDLLRRVKDQARNAQISPEVAFRNADSNRDSRIPLNEFTTAVNSLVMQLSHSDIDHLWMQLQKDREQQVSFQEFCKLFDFPTATQVRHRNFNALRDYIATQIRAKGLNLMQVFQQFDRNVTGFLERPEFREAVESLSLGLSSQEVEVLVAQGDYNRDGRIDIKEFCELLQPSSDIILILRRLLRRNNMSYPDFFNHFDKDRSGFVTREEFLTTMRELNIGITAFEATRLYESMDKDGDGRINYREFQKALEDPAVIEIEQRRERAPPQAPQVSEDEAILREIAQAMIKARIDIATAFRNIDRNGDGFLSRVEFIKLFQEMQLGLSTSQIEACLRRIDTSGDGRISFEEFKRIFQRYGYEVRATSAEARQGQPVGGRKQLRTVQELFMNTKEYMQNENKSLVNLFTKVFDQNKDSWISKDEMKRGFDSILRYPLTEQETNSLMQAICTQNQSRFQFNMFRDAFNKYTVGGDVGGQRTTTRQDVLQAAESMNKSMQRSRTGFKKQ